MNYKITLTEKQMRLISKSLDWYSRIEMGQFRTPIRESELCGNLNTKKINDALIILSNAFGFAGSNHSHGIYSDEVCQNAKEAHAMNKAIQHQMWMDAENKSPMSVHSNKTICCKINEPEIIIEKEGEYK